MFVTPGKPWADTIDCSYRKEHTAKDLVGLKGYLAAGTIVSVVEEKVSVWQGQMKEAGRENSCWGGAAVAPHSLWEALWDGGGPRPGPWVSQSLQRQLLSPGRYSRGLLMLTQKKAQ